jgi:hypothetical protein
MGQILVKLERLLLSTAILTSMTRLIGAEGQLTPAQQQALQGTRTRKKGAQTTAAPLAFDAVPPIEAETRMPDVPDLLKKLAARDWERQRTAEKT